MPNIGPAPNASPAPSCCSVWPTRRRWFACPRRKWTKNCSLQRRNCRIAATVSVGFDNIDVPACTRRRVVATNTPGVLDETTADFAWTLLMAVARRLIEGETWVRSGTWPGLDIDQLLGSDVWGKTLGIIGFGRIGRCVARRAQGFKMRVLYNNRNRVAPEIERELGAEFVDLDRLLRESDFVSVHAPLSPRRAT